MRRHRHLSPATGDRTHANSSGFIINNVPDMPCSVPLFLIMRDGHWTGKFAAVARDFFSLMFYVCCCCCFRVYTRFGWLAAFSRLSNAKNACEKMTGLADEGKKTCLRNN
jgi:hypothetical protein